MKPLPTTTTGNPLRSTKGLSLLLHRMGRTFDGLNASLPAVREFLQTGNPNVIGSRTDYALLLDLKAASSYALDTDWTDTDFNLQWLQGVNASMTRTAAMNPGQLRTAENVIVGTMYGTYTPPVPDPNFITGWLAEASETTVDHLHAASLLFTRLAKAQPFGDGNKRSALLAANGLLIRSNQNIMLSVPTEEPDRTEFNRLLGAWYIHDGDTIVEWLTDWNRHNQN